MRHNIIHKQTVLSPLSVPRPISNNKVLQPHRSGPRIKTLPNKIRRRPIRHQLTIITMNTRVKRIPTFQRLSQTMRIRIRQTMRHPHRKQTMTTFSVTRHQTTNRQRMSIRTKSSLKQRVFMITPIRLPRHRQHISIMRNNHTTHPKLSPTNSLSPLKSVTTRSRHVHIYSLITPTIGTKRINVRLRPTPIKINRITLTNMPKRITFGRRSLIPTPNGNLRRHPRNNHVTIPPKKKRQRPRSSRLRTQTSSNLQTYTLGDTSAYTPHET